jgi:CheY-like chemotaxis protein
LRLLIVDDDPEIALTLAEMLEPDGHAIDIAENGAEALERLAGQSFDLIISDLRMPDMDGPSLYRRLVRERPELARRMVFVTGDTLGADLTGFLGEIGARVLEKPLDPDEISRKVQTLLASGDDA